MPRVYASRAYHAAFPAEHAALEHPDRLLFLASLEGKDHFAHAHPGEPSCLRSTLSRLIVELGAMPNPKSMATGIQ